jgi:hypothetical protein
LTLLIGTALSIIDLRLQNPTAPYGMVSLEFAPTALSANEILASWNSLQTRAAAGLSLGLDYLWMPLYSTSIALGVLWAAARLAARFRLASLAPLLAWAQWLAAMLDAIENASLIVILDSNVALSPYPQIACIAASIKFALIGCGLLYVLLGGLSGALAKR